MSELKKNMILTVKTEGYTSSGDAVCKPEGRAVFVKGALDGETCEIKILKAAKHVAYARAEKILEPSPRRVVPKCPAFGKCGGCTLLHMDYTEQLRYKKQAVNDALRRIGGLDLEIAAIHESPETEFYRNKVIYNIGRGRDGNIIYGFYRRASHDIVPSQGCVIGFESADIICRTVIDYMNRFGVEPYDPYKKTGKIRHVFIRRGRVSGQIQVGIISKTRSLPNISELTVSLCRACPDIVSIILNVNNNDGNTVLSGDFYTVFGTDAISDSLCGIDFSLSIRSFYQVNPLQAENLYGKVLEYAALDKDDTALDLYCGTGTITLCLARRCRLAIGAEIVGDAIKNAEHNADFAGIKNVKFYCSDASDIAERFSADGFTPDVITVDPPRKGLAPDVIEAICRMSPKRVVYVSCDPGTLSRDLKLFSALGYVAKIAECYDMFPNCSHVETVVKLEREAAEE